MDSHQQKNSHGTNRVKNETKPKPHVVSILHHNVQIINNKLLELNVLLRCALADADILCLSEY